MNSTTKFSAVLARPGVLHPVILAQILELIALEVQDVTQHPVPSTVEMHVVSDVHYEIPNTNYVLSFAAIPPYELSPMTSYPLASAEVNGRRLRGTGYAFEVYKKPPEGSNMDWRYEYYFVPDRY